MSEASRKDSEQVALDQAGDENDDAGKRKRKREEGRREESSQGHDEASQPQKKVMSAKVMCFMSDTL